MFFFMSLPLASTLKNKIYGYNNNYEIKKNLYINTKDKKDKNIKQKHQNNLKILGPSHPKTFNLTNWTKYDKSLSSNSDEDNIPQVTKHS